MSQETSLISFILHLSYNYLSDKPLPWEARGGCPPLKKLEAQEERAGTVQSFNFDFQE